MESYWLERQEKEYKKKQEFKKEMHLSTDYIDWIEKFTKENTIFATDSYLYDEDAVSEEEKENIFLLEALFEVITEYADNNYINPEKKDYEIDYYIKHNDIGYQIGMNYGQGVTFHCARLEEPREESIEYKKLMSGVKLPSTIQAEYKLEELKELIERLVEEDVPIEAIHQTADATIQKIKVNKRSY